MDQRETDRLLGELFKRNAPYVQEAVLRERIEAKLPRRRRKSRRARTMRALAIGFASVILAGGLAFGAYRLATYLQDRPAMVITDWSLVPGDTAPPGPGETVPSAVARWMPVAGTADLDRVESEGVVTQTDREGYVSQVTGRVTVFSVEMSQPGVSGTLEITSDLGVRADGTADEAATWTLSNDQGVWQGDSWSGWRGVDGAEQFGFGQAVGTGGYEGLTLFLQWHSAVVPGAAGSGADAASVGPVTLTGWILAAE
jgi:hypothetical protein